MVNPDVLEFKEGEVGVACEVKLGYTECTGQKGLDSFDLVEEVKVG